MATEHIPPLGPVAQDESTPPLPGRSVWQFTGAGVSVVDDPTTGKTVITIAGGVGSAYQTVEDEGVALPQRTVMNFTGAGVTASDAGGETVVNIPGGGGYDTIEDEGVALTQRTTMNFVGAGVSAADAGGKTVITIPGGLSTAYQTVEDEGVALTQRTTMNFTGAGVTASDAGGKTVIDIPGVTEAAVLAALAASTATKDFGGGALSNVANITFAIDAGGLARRITAAAALATIPGTEIFITTPAGGAATAGAPAGSGGSGGFEGGSGGAASATQAAGVGGPAIVQAGTGGAGSGAQAGAGGGDINLFCGAGGAGTGAAAAGAGGALLIQSGDGGANGGGGGAASGDVFINSGAPSGAAAKGAVNIGDAGGPINIGGAGAYNTSLIMGDAAGVQKVQFKDSGGVEVAEIDSDGNFYTGINQLKYARTAVTADATLVENRIHGVTVAGAVVMTVPLAATAGAGAWIIVKNETATPGANSIQPTGADTIDGGVIISFTIAYQAVMLYSDGVSNWSVL